MQKYLCMPALIYVIFASVQIILDLFTEMYTLAFTKAFLAAIFTLFLNFLCTKGFSMISWILIVIPFILTLLLFEILIFILVVTNVFEKKSSEMENKEDKKINDNVLPKYMDISYSETPINSDAADIEEYHNLDLDLEMGLDV